MESLKIPSFYFAGKFNSFSHLFSPEGGHSRVYHRGDYLSANGEINNTAFYINRGILLFSLSHHTGMEKTVAMFGPGSIFPIGVKRHRHKMDYEMVMRAYTDLDVFALSYQELRAIAIRHPDLAMALLEEDCDFISYLFYSETSQAFDSSLIRVCDVLYLAMIDISEDTAVIEMSQAFLTTVVGMSNAQVERALKKLRTDGIIATARKRIHVLDRQKLYINCSESIKAIFA